MQQKTQTIPRYIVCLPQGTQEMDAAELLELYRMRQINFSTMIRPVGAEEFRRFDADPEFRGLLLPLYRQQALLVSWWYKLTPPLMIAAVLAVLPLMFPWSLVFLFLIFMGLYFTLGVLNCLLMSCARQPENPPSLNWQLLIPYWNCVAGYRVIRKFAAELPEERRKSALRVNPIFWGLLFACYLAGILLPAGRIGGMILYGLAWLLLIAWILLLRVFLTGFTEQRKRWKQENPPPPFWEKRLFPHPTPVWIKTDWRGIGKSLLIMSAAIVTGILCYVAPYLAVGQIRYQLALEKTPYSLLERPAEFPGGNLPEPPKETIYYTGFETPPEPISPQVRQALAEILPRLEQTRIALKQLDLPESDTINPANDQELSQNCSNYLSWRKIEFLCAENPAREQLTEVLFDDLDRLATLPHHGTENAMWSISSVNNIRLQLLEHSLRELTPERLKHEQAYWQQEEERRLPERIAKQSYLDLFRVFSSFHPPFWELWFSRGQQASALQFTQETLPLLLQELPETRSRLAELDQFPGDSGSLFLLLTMGSESSGKVVADARRKSRLARAAIEIELYRRKHGVYPVHPVLPRDPYAAQPLRYLPGQALYSVGSDGIDDGGRRHTPENRSDSVFRLSDAPRQ